MDNILNNSFYNDFRVIIIPGQWFDFLITLQAASSLLF